jgi:sulfite exporter TauE/SafE
MIWSAFILGLFGSMHCLGMCGPIALALPLNRSSKTQALLGALTYNLGRILTYAILGLVFGQIGRAFSLIGLQRWVSIGAGILLLVYVLFTYFIKIQSNPFPFWTIGIGRLKGSLQKQFKKRSLTSLLSIGLLNGLLPCGFVYFALVGAIGMATAIEGAGFMALFGLGTAPLMLAVNLLGNQIGARARRRFNQAIPIVLTVFAVLFIVRGLSLGIPFLSPIIDSAEPLSSGCH